MSGNAIESSRRAATVVAMRLSGKARLYACPLELQHTATAAEKSFQLLNLPYSLTSKLHEYVDWMTAQ